MVAPEVFDQRDQDGIVVVLRAEPCDDEVAAVREAATMCPAGVIRLVG